LLRSSSDRLIIADVSGVIVGDTSNQWLGKTTSSVGLSSGTPIILSNKKVGDLYLISSQVGRRLGYMGGGKGGPPTTSKPLVTAEQNFLNQFNRSLIIAGLIAAAVALIIGLI